MTDIEDTPLQPTDEYYVPENPLAYRVKSDYALSEKLLKIEYNEHITKYKPNILPDLAKANLSPPGYAAINKMGITGIETAFVGEQIDLDLKPAQAFMSEALNLKINSSRAKGGFSAYLSKTNKSVSEQSVFQHAQEIQQNFGEPKKGLMQKIFRK